MKRIIIAIAMLFALGANASAQSNYKRQGNDFVQVTNRTSAQAAKTACTWTSKDGEKYPIFLSKNGRAYVLRVSKKTGNEYKFYLGEEISREVCKTEGIKYVELKKK